MSIKSATLILCNLRCLGNICVIFLPLCMSMALILQPTVSTYEANTERNPQVHTVTHPGFLHCLHVIIGTGHISWSLTLRDSRYAFGNRREQTGSLLGVMYDELDKCFRGRRGINKAGGYS